MAIQKEMISYLLMASTVRFFYKELIKSGASFLDLPINLIALMASKLDLSSPTTTKPIMPIVL